MDHYYGEITIPKKYLNDKLLHKIEVALYTSDAMKKGYSSDDGITVTFSDEKARYGGFPELEEYLKEHNIPFDRSSAAYYDYPAEKYYFRSGQEITLTGDEREIPATVVRDVILGADDEKTAIGRLQELMDTVYDPKIIPLAEYVRMEELKKPDTKNITTVDKRGESVSENREPPIYSFDELPEPVRDSMIEENRDILIDENNEWYLPVYHKLCSDAAKYGLTVECKDISFSGFGAQGDGASFVCPKERVNTYTLFREGKFAEKFPELADEKVFDEVCYSIDLEIKSVDSHYSHHNTVSAYGDMYAFDRKLEPLLDKIVPEAEKYLDQVKDDLCITLYRNLEDYYDDLRSDAKVAGAIRERDELYYSDGIPTRGSAESLTKLSGRLTEEQQEKFIALMESDLNKSRGRTIQTAR